MIKKRKFQVKNNLIIEKQINNSKIIIKNEKSFMPSDNYINTKNINTYYCEINNILHNLYFTNLSRKCGILIN